jgi:hypothetical protein
MYISNMDHVGPTWSTLLIIIANYNYNLKAHINF